jgi:hypothetical protein
MISFKCPGCEIQLEVPDDKSGIRGKCPTCDTIITVPEYSNNTLMFLEDAISCKNEHLQKLYSYLLENYSEHIKMHKVDEDDNITILVKTGKLKNRTQNVSVSIVNSDVLGELVIIGSPIGALDDPATLLEVFRGTVNNVLVRTVLKEDNMLVVIADRKLSTCDTKEFEVLVDTVANWADGVEQILFDWDVC